MKTTRKSDQWWAATKEDYWNRHDQEEVTAELDRARASEKALADALVKVRERGLHPGHRDLGPEIDAALRIAGRLP